MSPGRALPVLAILATAGSATPQWVASEQAVLTASTAADFDEFGDSAALDGDTAVFGAPMHDGAGSDAGSAFVYVRSGTIWTEQATLVASDAGPGDGFGQSVGIDGDTIVVGAPRHDGAAGSDAGAAYVFVRSGTTWTEQAKLEGAMVGAELGYAVEIDGDTVIAGAWRFGDGQIEEVWGLAYDRGSGRLYGTEQANGSDRLVLIDRANGATTVVGSTTTGFFEVDGLAFDPGTNTLFGSDTMSDQLITIDTTTGVGQAIGPLGFTRVRGLAFDPLTNTLYGCDNPTRNLIVIDTATGAGTVVGGLGFAGVRSLAFDAVTNRLYGVAVVDRKLIRIDTSTGAGTIVGGTPSSINGLAHEPGQDVLYASKATSLLNVDRITAKTAVVGFFDLPEEAGAARIFVRNGTSWQQQVAITSNKPGAFDNFGNAVAVHEDFAVVGAMGTDQGNQVVDSGAAWAFRRSGTEWNPQSKLEKTLASPGDHFGESVDLHGDRIVVGTPLDHFAVGTAGTANVFRYDGAGWNQEKELKAANPMNGDRFGRSVSIEGTTIVVGADQDHHSGRADAGSAHTFAHDGLGWKETVRFWASDPEADARFGRSVSLSGSSVVVGAFLDDHAGGVDAGSAYVFELAPIGVNYCTAGSSANGCRAKLAALGLPSASAPSGFSLSATNVEGAKDGLFFFSANGRQASPWGNGTSFQCVAPPVRRGGLMIGIGTALACDGTFDQDLNAHWCPTCPKPQHNPGAGAVVQAQLWYRDPWNTSNQATSFSDAIEFTVQP